MLDKLQCSDFVLLLHQSFKVRLGSKGEHHLELVSAAEVGLHSSQAVRHPFSLQFLGPPSNQYLQQHTYRLEHETLGDMDIFIVPLGPEAGRMRYEAIFS